MHIHEIQGRRQILTRSNHHICQSKHPEADPHAPSRELSKYFGKDVHLIYKGPRPRPCEPTLDFPELAATAVFQDGYPLLVASEESLRSIQARIRGQIGVQGVEDRWAMEDLEITRYVFLPFFFLTGHMPVLGSRSQESFVILSYSYFPAPTECIHHSLMSHGND